MPGAWLAACLATGLTLVLALTLVALAPSANADGWRHTDSAGDVHVGIYDPPSAYYAPAIRKGDVRAVKANFGNRRFVVNFTFRAAGRANSTLEVPIRTGSRDYWVSLQYFGDRYLYMYDRDDYVDCNGLRGRIVGKRGFISVPASCIGQPQRLRFGLRALRYFEDRVQTDKGLRHRSIGSPGWSPVIRRG